MIEDTTTPAYNGVKILTSIIKLSFLLALMGLTFWLIRYLEDLDHIYYWLETFGGAFGAIVLIIDPILIFLFACFFKCAGPSRCSAVAGAILLGNCHKNLINGLLYELNNN